MEYDGEETPVTGADRVHQRPRPLDEVRARLRVRHYSLRTWQAYLYWIRRYIREYGGRHPRELDGVVLTAFLTRRAVRDKVSANTQNQASSALLFLYR